jgi:hypothetical protein
MIPVYVQTAIALLNSPESVAIGYVITKIGVDYKIILLLMAFI